MLFVLPVFHGRVCVVDLSLLRDDGGGVVGGDGDAPGRVPPLAALGPGQRRVLRLVQQGQEGGAQEVDGPRHHHDVVQVAVDHHQGGADADAFIDRG